MKLRTASAMPMIAALAVSLFVTFSVNRADAQVPGSALGPVGRSVSGSVDRGVHAEVGNRVGGSSGGAKPHGGNTPTSLWVPTRGGGSTTQTGFSGLAERQASGGPEEEQGPVSARPKEETVKRAGRAPVNAGGSFAPASKGFSNFGFTGKGQKPSSRDKEAREKEDRQFERQTQARGGMSTSRRKRGRAKLPHTLTEPQGQQDCDQSSALKLCTWL